MLSAAIGGGRHDAVLMISPCAIGGLHPCLMSLLLSCARHGVAAGSSLPRRQLHAPQPGSPCPQPGASRPQARMLPGRL
jgi:hypothetical protein